MKTVAIVQARMGSTRLPGKVLKPILSQPMLWHIIKRLQFVQPIGEVVVATSDQPSDEPIRRFCTDAKISFFAGSETDVLDRFYRTALEFNGNPLLRITADCPFVDPQVVSHLITLYGSGYYDHVGVATGAGALFMHQGRFPDGLDAECFSFDALERAWREASHPLDREHVTPYIWRNKELFRGGSLYSNQDYSHLRWTVDNAADFEMVCQVYAALYREDEPFLMPDIIGFLSNHPGLAAYNQTFIGQEGYAKVWKVEARTGQN